SSDVSVLLGQGDGTFQPGQLLTVGTSPSAVAVADLNGDGHPDLVVANAGSNKVAVLRGQGDGALRRREGQWGGVQAAAAGVARRWRTSMAITGLISSSPIRTPAMCRCCWARAMAPSGPSSALPPGATPSPWR